MSNTQLQRIQGKLKLADIKKLRDKLVISYTREITNKFTGKPIAKKDILKISSRMHEFTIYEIYEDTDYVTKKKTVRHYGLGWISLDMKTGVVKAGTEKNNRTVDRIYASSPTWNTLVDFLRDMEETKSGTTYGATIAYIDEYLEHDMCGPEVEECGDWKPKNQRDINQKSKRGGYHHYGRY